MASSTAKTAKMHLQPTISADFSALALPSVILTLLLSAASHSALADQAPLAAQNDHSQHYFVLDDRAWINDIGTLLYDDRDKDGFFSGIGLSIDADTAYASFEVYAAIDIIHNNNVNSERLHTTRDFELYGNRLTDEYRVDIDLLSDFSPDQYDLRISLVDASNDEVIDQVSADDFHNLQSLSLESEDYEDVYVPVTEQSVEPVEGNVRVVEYAGSTSYFILIITTVLLALRRRKHPQ